MRDFSWQYFTITGDIDAYLLYREHGMLLGDAEERLKSAEDDPDWHEPVRH